MEQENLISIKHSLGNASILKVYKTAFLCSRKVPATTVLQCYDWAIAQRQAGNCIISGFHSKIEQDVFHYLAKGKQPVIIALHRGLKTRWEPQIAKMLDEGRLLIVTPFDHHIKRGTEETARLRNQLMLELADEVKVGYIKQGGELEKLLHNSQKSYDL